MDDLEFNIFNDKNFDKLFSWLQNLTVEDFHQPESLFFHKNNGFTDTDYPSISINFLSSLDDFSNFVGFEVSKGRFRGNIWVKDSKPWVESTFVGKKIQIGNAVLEVIEPILRCRTTEINEKTGLKDIDTLKILKKVRYNVNFGIYCKVINDGLISINDKVKLI